MSPGKSYIASCHVRAWLHQTDCGLARIKRDDSEVVIQALGEHVRITGLGMSYFTHAIVSFQLREQADGQT